MEELIKYFEALEARLTALEAKEQALQAWEERLTEVEKAQQENLVKLQGIGQNINKMIQTLKEVQSVQPEAAHVAAPAETPIEIPVAEPEPIVIAPEPVVKPEPIIEPQPVITEPVNKTAPSNAALYGKPVDDIRLAISLGDRFLYQRELFGQNAELMQRTLSELNELQSFDEATAYISSHFQWDTDSNTYQQFIVTLHRRFG